MLNFRTFDDKKIWDTDQIKFGTYKTLTLVHIIH